MNSNGVSAEGKENFFKVMFRFASGEFDPKPPKKGYRAFQKEQLVKPDLSPGASPSVTWLGHAGILLQSPEGNFLFDPILSLRASPVSFLGPKRRVASPVTVKELPEIHGIFISHDHFDHLDKPTLTDLLDKQKESQPHVYVPLGLKTWFESLGFKKVHEMDWWNETSHNDKLVIKFFPNHHWSRRSLFSKNQTLWGAFYLKGTQSEPWSFIHLGDTAYSTDFKEIGKQVGPIDLAAIPIGAYEPKSFMSKAHVDPDDAVKIFTDLNAASAVGIHWGTFEMAKEALDQPPIDLSRALIEKKIEADRFWLLKQGERRHFGPTRSPK